jgi:hypothetical protein
MADGIDIGDAVLTFTGNTQQLDQAFARVQAGAQQTAAVSNTAMAEMSTASDAASESVSGIGEAGKVAGTQITEGMQKGTVSIREAKGEAALLGEAFGIHLPRHVRSFVAELPGVGEALSAAFAATAVLFLVEALVKGTEKVVEFINEAYLFTEAMRENDAQIKETNKTLSEQSKELSKLKLEYQLAGLQGVAKLNKELELLHDTLKEGRKSFQDAKDDLDDLTKHQATWEAKMESGQSTWRKAIDGLRSFVGMETSTTTAYYKELGEAQDDFLKASKQNDITEQEIANKKKERDAEAVKAHAEALKKQAELEKIVLKQKQDLEKEYEKGVTEESKALTARLEAQVKGQLKVSEALIKQLEEQRKAYEEELSFEEKALETSTNRKAQAVKLQLDKGKIGQKEYVAQITALYNEELRQLIKLINEKEALLNKDDARQLVEFKKLELDKAKLAEDASHKIAEATKKDFDIAKTAVDSFIGAFASSVSALASGSATVSAVMEKMAESVLQSIAQQAGAQGAKELALAIGDLAPDSEGFGHSGEHFVASAKWFALDAALSAAGGAISGASSGGSGTSAPRGTQGVSTSSTSQSIGSGPVNQKNVQRFAAGGLISGPTMAMLGDSMERSAGQSEAAIPLDNPRAVSKIKDALGGGGGLTINVHTAGVISGDNLGKVIQKISQRVKKGQSVLHASNSFRVTKRSS